jgi:hypothetical protein
MLSPIARAVHHAIAAQPAIHEDGNTSLQHHAEKLIWAIGRAMMRRVGSEARRELQ